MWIEKEGGIGEAKSRFSQLYDGASQLYDRASQLSSHLISVAKYYKRIACNKEQEVKDTEL